MMEGFHLTDNDVTMLDEMATYKGTTKQDVFRGILDRAGEVWQFYKEARKQDVGVMKALLDTLGPEYCARWATDIERRLELEAGQQTPKS